MDAFNTCRSCLRTVKSHADVKVYEIRLNVDRIAEAISLFPGSRGSALKYKHQIHPAAHTEGTQAPTTQPNN